MEGVFQFGSVLFANTLLLLHICPPVLSLRRKENLLSVNKNLKNDSPLVIKV